MGRPANPAHERPRRPLRSAGPGRFRMITRSELARLVSQIPGARPASAPGVIALCDPNWGETERAQAASVLGIVREAAAPAAGWLLIPTGGTGGRIRFARHDERTIAAAVRGFTAHFDLPRVNAVGLLPRHHVSGLMGWLRCVLTGGEHRPADWRELAAGALPDLPDRAESWVLSLVPTQLERMLRQPAAVGWLRGLRTVFLGGAPAWPDLLDRAAEAGIPLSLSYGMTETAAMVAALRPGEFARGARDCGTALPHASLTIAPDGAIRVAGESVFHGYWPDFRSDRSHATADLGRIDPQGHLHVLGRRDEIIVTGGEKVDPPEVEAALRATGEFADIVVLGLPHPQWGAQVVAVYPAGTSPDLARVRTALGRALAPYKHPKEYVALTNWPRTEAGKLNRADLATRARAGL